MKKLEIVNSNNIETFDSMPEEYLDICEVHQI